jgi:hypothetical protein
LSDAKLKHTQRLEKAAQRFKDEEELGKQEGKKWYQTM